MIIAILVGSFACMSVGILLAGISFLIETTTRTRLTEEAQVMIREFMADEIKHGDLRRQFSNAVMEDLKQHNLM